MRSNRERRRGGRGEREEKGREREKEGKGRGGRERGKERFDSERVLKALGRSIRAWVPHSA